jgi:dTDP-4-amino-4,6-dideoxygalactose transaminase
VHFDPPLHKQKYLNKYRKKLKNTDFLAKEIVTLPIFPDLKKSQTFIIFKTINEWYKKNVKK